MKKIVLITAMFAFTATAAFAHCGKCGLGEGKEKGSMKAEMMEKKVDKLTEKLGLSEEQAGQLEAAINEKIEKKKAAKEEYWAKVKEILTEEQLEKYKAHKAERYEHKGSMHEHKGSHKGSEKESKKGS